MTVKYEWETQKTISWCVKGYGAMKYWSLVMQLSCSCPFSLISHQLHWKSLYFSVPLYEDWLWLFVIRRSKLKNSSTKCQSPSQNWSVVKKNHPFLADRTDGALRSHYSLWLSDILPDHPSVGSTTPIGWPSASLEFFHSLIPPHYACCSPRHNFRKRSLFMRVLSHSDTHHLNRHMG